MQNTAIIIAVFNLDEYRLCLLDFVLRQLRRQSESTQIFLGVMSSPGSIQLNAGVSRQVDKIFSVEGNPYLFQKEAIWNAVARQLPDQIENFIFLDGDVFPVDLDWIQKCADTLKGCDFAQGYSLIMLLSAVKTSEILRDPYHPYSHEDLTDGPLNYLRPLESTHERTNAQPSFLFGLRHATRVRGASNGCWMMKRSFFDLLEGLTHEEVFGGQNGPLMLDRMGLVDWPLFRQRFPNDTRFQRLKASPKVSFAPRRLYHLWHKPSESREYTRRTRQLMDLNYSPREDIQLTPSGGIELTSAGLRLEPFAKVISATILRTESSHLQQSISS